MTKKYFVWSLMAMFFVGSVFTSCSDDSNASSGEDDDDDSATTESGYVMAAGVDDSDYLLTSTALTSGTVSAVGTGTEATAATAWVFYNNKYLYNLVYNQGSSGGTASYYLDASGAMTKRSNEYSITRFTSYGVCGENLVTVSAVDTDNTDSDGNAKKGLGFNFLHAEDQVLSTASYVCEDYLGNGEYVTLAGFVEIDGKYYTSAVPMGMSAWGVSNYTGEFDESKVSQESGGSSSSSYDAGVIPATQYPDSAYIAIYTSADFSDTPTIIRTGEMGFACGRMRSQYYQTIQADDEGNLYVFSPGYGRMHTATYYTTGELGARVMRINSGETEFDESYGAVDLEALSDGCSFLRVWHITDDYFLLQMFTAIEDNASNPGYLNARGTGATGLAVYRGSTKTFTTVTGLPDADVISSFGSTPYAEDGYIYVGVVTSDGSYPTIYQINPTTATATAGLVVEAEDISAIGKLEYQE
ncbi:MAG: DUF4374 domain-containing protein [Bacteroides sp.]|nr:DUF4374 domain-containing protein [Bacteroides sp.]